MCYSVELEDKSLLNEMRPASYFDSPLIYIIYSMFVRMLIHNYKKDFSNYYLAI